jgi:hypothetical protein
MAGGATQLEKILQEAVEKSLRLDWEIWNDSGRVDRIRKNERYILKLGLTNEKPYPLDQVELRLHTVSSQYAKYFGKECRLFADADFTQQSGELVFAFGRIAGGGKSETQIAYIEASDDVDPSGRASALEYEIRAAFNPLAGSATGKIEL